MYYKNVILPATSHNVNREDINIGGHVHVAIKMRRNRLLLLAHFYNDDMMTAFVPMFVTTK